MSRIGILTYHFSNNYGALFQAYALRQWFIQNGHDATLLNYHPDYLEQGGSFSLSQPFTRRNLKVAFLKLTALKGKLFGNRTQLESFANFRKVHLGVNGPEFKDVGALGLQLDGFDMLVCGSDQIWNVTEHYGVDPAYFLDFKTRGHSPRRISYAPSFGKDTLIADYRKEVGALIRNLDAVSVREESGCRIVEDLTGMTPCCVPDPTFLLSDYSSIFKTYPGISEDFVFCYVLRSRDVVAEAAHYIAEKYGCRIYSPHNPHRRWPEIGQTVYPCPQQWLHLLQSSKFVVTNSFHGAALSILLKKQFIVVGLQGKKSPFNARVYNLLSLVGLKDRFLKSADASTLERVLAAPIAWSQVEKNVAVLRQAGKDYLRTEVSKIPANVTGAGGQA